MFFYDDDGELQHTPDSEKKTRQHVKTMLRTTSYNLRPSAAAGLPDLLGDVDPAESRKEARRRVRRALEEAGLSGTPVSVAVEALGDEWEAKIRVGSSAANR